MEFQVSHLAKVSRKTDSLRTTIPQNVVKELELVYKGVMRWEIYTEKSTGEKIAKVRKVR